MEKEAKLESTPTTKMRTMGASGEVPDEENPDEKTNDNHNSEKNEDKETPTSSFKHGHKRHHVRATKNPRTAKKGRNNKNTAASTERTIQEAEVTTNQNGDHDKNDDHDDFLEDFERGASPWVTKQEALQRYCLPASTLAVCTVHATQPNPRQVNFAPMKLYARAEIRQRARQRFGGLAGLQAERRKREHAQLQRDLDRAKQFFG